MLDALKRFYFSCSLLLAVAVFTACASTSQKAPQEGGQKNAAGEEGNENEDNNEASANFNNGQGGEEGNDYGNDEGGEEEGGNGYEGEGNATAEGNGGENVNNAGGEEFANSGDGGGFTNDQAVFNNQGDGGNMGVTEPMADTGESVNNATEPDSFGATNATSGMQGAVEQPAMDASVSPAVDGSAMGSGTGVVRYVVEGGGQLYQEMGGQVVKNLEQGDHPLVNESGEWARTSDGYYVPTANLTAAPVGRLKQPAVWY